MTETGEMTDKIVPIIENDVTALLTEILGSKEVSKQDYSVKVLTQFTRKWYHQGAVDALKDMKDRIVTITGPKE